MNTRAMRCAGALALAALILAACGDELKRRKADRAEGRTFSVPVPDGFSIVDVPGDSSGSLALSADERAYSGATLTSIVITPIEGLTQELDVSDEKTCARLGQEITAAIPVTVNRLTYPYYSHGTTCEIHGDDTENERRVVRWTMMYRDKSDVWSVMCMYDVDDESAVLACDEVLRGWTYTDTAEPSAALGAPTPTP